MGTKITEAVRQSLTLRICNPAFTGVIESSCCNNTVRDYGKPPSILVTLYVRTIVEAETVLDKADHD